MISTIEHVGEWKVAARAPTLEELFAQMARFIGGTGGRPANGPGPWEPVALEAADHEALLVDWANELIGRGEIAQCAYGEVRDLAITPGGGSLRLAAQVRGRPLVEWRSPLKAATYHQALIQRVGKEWRAQLLFDV